MFNQFTENLRGYVTNGWVETIPAGERDPETYVWHNTPTKYDGGGIIVGSEEITIVTPNQTKIYRGYIDYTPAVNFFPQRIILKLYLLSYSGSQTVYIRGLSSPASGQAAADLYADIIAGNIYKTFTVSGSGILRFELDRQAILDWISHPTWFSLGIHGSTSGSNYAIFSISGYSLEIIGGFKPTQ